MRPARRAASIAQFPPLDLQVVELLGQGEGIGFVFGQKAGDAHRHIVEPAGGIDARPQRKAHIERLRFAPVALGHLEKRADAGAHIARAHTLEPLRHQNAVVVIKRRHIGHGAQRHQIEQAAQIRLGQAV